MLVGRVVGVFGLRGDVKVAAPFFELQPGLQLMARGLHGAMRSLRVEHVRSARDHVRVRFAGVDDATAAEDLRGMALHVRPEDMPALPANAYRESELVGMQVVDATLGSLGSVAGIAHYPGSDMLIVGEKRVLLPLLEAFGVRIDRAARLIRTSLPAGFEDLL